MGAFGLRVLIDEGCCVVDLIVDDCEGGLEIVWFGLGWSCLVCSIVIDTIHPRWCCVGRCGEKRRGEKGVLCTEI